jgi:outer membrane biosynthesis protein TonB
MKFRPNADMMASVLVHLLLLALIFLYSEVHQFDPVAADTMPVEVVTQQEAAEVKPDPAPEPSPTPELRLPSLDDKPSEHAAAQPEAQQSTPQTQPAPQPQQKQAAAPQPPQKQTPAPKPSPAPQQHAAVEPPPTPQLPSQAAPQSPPPVAQQPAPSPPAQQPPVPAYTAPEPDVSVKYHVMLGLPPDLSVQAPSGAAPSGPEPGKDNFDAPATEKADIGSSVVAQFRSHLKSCMKLPATLSPSDDVRVKLRVVMNPDGKLAAAPQLIEASASMKGPLLMQSATSALQACQPYAMLPRARYGEWKVLDLDFTPRDFGS